MEYFLVDGGSTDGSVEIIRQYEHRIDWWVSETDDGQSEAINKGFKRASGELLCWVNSDDVLFPACLQIISEWYLEKAKPDIIHANSAFIEENGMVMRMYRLPRRTRFFLEQGVWFTPPPAVFFKVSLLKKIGYLSNEYQFCMDLDLWKRMIQAGARVAFVPKYLGGFRWHKGSKTANAAMSKKNRSEETPEARKILNEAIGSSTEHRRLFWRRVWKMYQIFSFNYFRSYFETQRVKGKHWKEAF